MKEKEFVKLFTSVYNEELKAQCPDKGPNQSSQADCSVVIDDVLVLLEVKILRNTNSNSGEFHKLFGELLLMRSFVQECNAVEYGVLIPESSYSTFLNEMRKYHSGTLKLFMSEFKVRHLLLFDEINMRCRHIILEEIFNIIS
ncbi:hypothetical protein [Butyrivibrio sp. YAB3001]|uniref:hypothetical protein n=1 Tax=Butyrivibrio sp. YAB3001 TaxID=1520812 RepID=UPI0008F6832E|nr:hypothetical protein [Butyrivibrio sp. YAB3001]SFB88793.1 hypothetical protein SAMN02910398_01016 [Butyrivibrio sp. YAB3001]